ncbi:MAG: LytR/AlgR family response regulator transcription factor [Marinilabiliaceae bacterium]
MTEKINVLIVEDEFMIAEDIAMRLGDMGYHVAGKSESVEDAVSVLENEPVDILLIDISLRGERTGIDLAAIVNEHFHLPFVFLTSLANESIVEKARRVNPSAYLLKPFNDRQVKVSIDMALWHFYGDGKKKQPDPHEAPEDHATEFLLQMPGCLFLRNGAHYTKVRFDDILWLEADSNYTVIHTRDEKFTYSSVLKNFEEKLPKEDFVRVHRSYIVNLKNVTGFEGNMLLIGEKQIPVNKSCRDLVFKRFNII